MSIRTAKEGISAGIKTLIKLALSVVLHYSGAVALYRALRRKKSGKIEILAYHDISEESYFNLQVPPKVFESHIQHLVNADYNILSLDEAADILRSKRPVPRDSVVITFDDGYKSIYKSVYPVIRKYGVPVTVFISTDPIDSGSPLFVDAIAYALANTPRTNLDLVSYGLKDYRIKPSSLIKKAGEEINEFSKNLSSGERKKLLESIFAQLGIDPGAADLRNKMLSWEEINEIKGRVSFGAHTVFHPSLSRIPKAEAAEEILRSKNRIQEKTGKDVRTFAYPYGSVRDVNEEVRNILEANRFSCACTLQKGCNGHGQDLFLLKRTCVTNQLTFKPLRVFATAMFSVQISGILGFLKSRETTY